MVGLTEPLNKRPPWGELGKKRPSEAKRLRVFATRFGRENAPFSFNKKIFYKNVFLKKDWLC